MAVQESRSERGPLINPRRVDLMAFVDPLRTGRRQPHTFSLDVFDLIDTETHATATLRGKVIDKTATHNDFYGLGTSQEEVIAAAQEMYEKYAGTGTTVAVTTRFITTPVFLNPDKEPFYSGAVEVFRVPDTCFLPSDGPPYRSIHQPPQDFTIWVDGAYTPAHDVLTDLLHTALAQDAAGSARKPRKA